jgi:hypothetical protein
MLHRSIPLDGHIAAHYQGHMNFFEQYEHAIGQIVLLCPAPDKFAHVFAGLILWLGSALTLRRHLASLVPLAVVVLFETGNEIIDFFAHGGWEWHDTLGDAAATWFWPAVLWAAVRLCPWLTDARSRKLAPVPDEEAASHSCPHPAEGQAAAHGVQGSERAVAEASTPAVSRQ